MRRATSTMVALCILGCLYVPTTSLQYEPMATAHDLTPTHRIVVLPLSEARSPKLYPGMFGRMFMTYIPLIPYIKIPYERLDESYILHQTNIGSTPAPGEHFTIAFAREIARDLERARMFREVSFARTEKDASDADLVLQGVLKSSQFDIYVSSYMLGMVGVLLWVLPIPVGKDQATVSLELTLRDRDGKQLWSYAGSQNASRLFLMYGWTALVSGPFRIEIERYGSNELGIDGDSLWAYHAQALRSVLGDAKASLADYLAQAK